MKTITNIISVAFAAIILAFFGLSSTQAVSPAPDGGYPGGNTAEGQNALLSLTSGGYNTAIGYLSLSRNVTGGFNTAIGAATLLVNTGNNNTATGVGALLSNAIGNFNTADGALALSHNTIGSSNTATGVGALSTNTIGIGNTANGASALYYNSSGSYNIAYGDNALASNTTGGGNIALGHLAGLEVVTASNVISIGVYGANVSNSCYIGNIAGQTVGAGGTTCYVDNDGKLGVFLSARRFKTDIADMGNASEALLGLRPVTFRYKPELDKTAIPQFGLVAEEVAAVNPKLVTHDAKGQLSTVRYEAVNAMLLNEFLKEHKKVETLEGTVASLVATMKEQAKQIHEVSAQLQASKPAPQVVNNP